MATLFQIAPPPHRQLPGFTSLSAALFSPIASIAPKTHCAFCLSISFSISSPIPAANRIEAPWGSGESALFTPYPQKLNCAWHALSAQSVLLEGIKRIPCSEEVTQSQQVGEEGPWGPCHRAPPGSSCHGLESSAPLSPSCLQLGRPWAWTPQVGGGDLLQAAQQVHFLTPPPTPDHPLAGGETPAPPWTHETRVCVLTKSLGPYECTFQFEKPRWPAHKCPLLSG